MAALTQGRAFGAFTGQRYGSFDGRGGRSVGRLTQARAFGAFTGAIYGTFAGRTSVIPPVVHPDRGGRVMFARPIHKHEQDDILLLIAAQIAIGMLNESTPN